MNPLFETLRLVKISKSEWLRIAVVFRWLDFAAYKDSLRFDDELFNSKMTINKDLIKKANWRWHLPQSINKRFYVIQTT